MKFSQLNKHIPKGTRGKVHGESLDIQAGEDWSVRVKYPGKYGPNDYVVQIKSRGVWDRYKSFTHGDFFEDVDAKSQADAGFMASEWLPHAFSVVQGTEPPEHLTAPELPGIALDALTVGTQALAVCEYRRYPQGDVRGGGRYLPLNFTAAMLFGHWTADEAWASMRQGLPALRQLEDFKPFKHTDNVDVYFFRLTDTYARLAHPQD